MGNLPSKTKSLSVKSIKVAQARDNYLRPDDVSEEAIWSYYAGAVCGGYDVYEDLLDTALRGKYTTGYTARVFAYDLDQHKKALTCGKTVAEDAGANIGAYWLTFKHSDDKTASVALFPLGLEKLPKSVKYVKSTSDPSNLQSARCQVKWGSDSDADCGDRSGTVARIEDTTVWVAGDVKDQRVR